MRRRSDFTLALQPVVDLTVQQDHDAAEIADKAVGPLGGGEVADLLGRHRMVREALKVDRQVSASRLLADSRQALLGNSSGRQVGPVLGRRRKRDERDHCLGGWENGSWTSFA